MIARSARRAILAGSLASLAGMAPTAQADETPSAHIQPSDAQLRARHALPQSQFETIAGETIHFADEGQGPAIVLLHGSFASLRQWDFWAERLSREFRVIRFDLSPAGLSGPHPAGLYSIEQRVATIDALADRLGVDRFVIVGTSSSGTPAAAYAALRPDRVTGVVLSNIALGPLQLDYDAFPPAMKAALAEDRTHPTYHLPEFWRQILLHNVEHDERLSEDLVLRWTELNNRHLADPEVGRAAAAALDFARTPGDLAAITAPTLLLWSQEDHEVPLSREGVAAFDALTVEDRELVAIGGCGHMIALDCPERSYRAVLPFLRRVTEGERAERDED